MTEGWTHVGDGGGVHTVDAHGRKSFGAAGRVGL